MLFLLGRHANMHRTVDRLMYHERGQILMSIVFGLALAFLFQRVCKDRKCIVLQAPPLKDLERHVYQFHGQCFRYEPYAVPCASGAE